MHIDPVEMLKRMVEIPSPSGREGEVAAYLTGAMLRLGFDAEIDEAGNAVGIRGERGPDCFEIVLLGHMDTVPAQIPVRFEGDVLFGRGTVDAKGPLAAFVCAAADLELPAQHRIVVIGAVEEEAATSWGARSARKRFSPGACVIGEPSGWNGVTLGYKGRLLADAVLEQPTGHSAGPETGAGERMVQWWQRIRTLCDEYNGGRQGLFKSLIPDLRSINTSSTGLKELAEAGVGFRLPPGMDAAGLRKAVAEIDEGVRVRFRGYEQAYSGRPDSPLVRAFTGAIRGMGARPKLKYKTGTSDMNVVGPVWQCPIAAYGPGDSKLDHTPFESISIEEYTKCIAVLKKALRDLSAKNLANGDAGPLDVP